MAKTFRLDFEAITANAERGFQKLGEESQSLTRKLNTTSRAELDVRDAALKMEAAQQRAARASSTYGAGSFKAAQAATQFEKSQSRLQTELDKTSRSSKLTAGALGGIASAVKFGAVTAGITGLSVALSKIGSSTIDFDRGMRNVNSIAQLSEGQLKGLEKQVLALAGKTAQAPKTLAAGLYDLVSSGFDAKQSMTILASSAKAATAGLTTTEISTKAVAAVLNAYHRPAKDAAQISDDLFQTVNRGVISFETLASSIGDVLPFASSLGIGLKPVGAAIATMTKEGLSGEEATTRLKNVMVALLKPGDDMTKAIKAAGFASGEALIKHKGFQGALEALIGTTDGSKAAIAKLFPNIRALGGALALTGKNTKSAEGDLKNFQNTGGATDKALSQQAKSISYQWNRLKAIFSSWSIAAGLALIDATHAVVAFVRKNKAEFDRYISAVTQIFRGFATSVRGIVEIIGGILTLNFKRQWTGVKHLFQGGIGEVEGVLNLAKTPVRKAVDAIGKGITAGFSAVWDGVLSKAEWFINKIIDVINVLPGVNIKHFGGDSGPSATTGSSAPRPPAGGQSSRPRSVGAFMEGGKVTMPIAIMGEEAPQHPEWVIPTNPAYRQRAVGLWMQAAKDIGVPGFALGGLHVPSPAKALDFVTGLPGKVAGSAGSIASSIVGKLPHNPFTGDLAGMGSFVLDAIGRFIGKRASGVFNAAKDVVTAPFSGGATVNGLLPRVLRALEWARGHGWHGSVTSGFRSHASQQYLWDHAAQLGLVRGISVAKPGTSSHESGAAVDVTDIAGFKKAMATAPPDSRLLWRGPTDPVHFSITGHRRGGKMFAKFAQGGKWSAKQLAGLAARVGFPKSTIPTAVAVSLAESGGRQSASNRNSDGSIDRGLWQINSVHGSQSTFNPTANARAAYAISSHGRNWSPWTTYTSGAYKQFLSTGTRAAGSVSASGGRKAKPSHMTISSVSDVASNAPGAGGFQSYGTEVEKGTGSGNIPYVGPGLPGTGPSPPDFTPAADAPTVVDNSALLQSIRDELHDMNQRARAVTAGQDGILSQWVTEHLIGTVGTTIGVGSQMPSSPGVLARLG